MLFEIPQSNQPNYSLIFTSVGGGWAVLTASIAFFDNRRKQKNEERKLIKEYNDQLRVWADIVISTMTTAGLFCDIDPQKDQKFFFEKRHDLLIRLSSEIDKGRLFLPNTGIDEFGQYKESAYRGFRSEAMNSITKCYKLIESLNYLEQKDNTTKKALIMAEKRKFVSEIQKQIDPQKYELNFIGKIKQNF